METTTHVPLEGSGLNRLRAALKMNGVLGEDGAVLVMSGDTSFAGELPDLPTDAEVVSAIRAVPTHY